MNAHLYRLIAATGLLAVVNFAANYQNCAASTGNVSLR